MCRARAVPSSVDADDAALVAMQEYVELTQDQKRYVPPYIQEAGRSSLAPDSSDWRSQDEVTLSRRCRAVSAYDTFVLRHLLTPHFSGGCSAVISLLEARELLVSIEAADLER